MAGVGFDAELMRRRRRRMKNRLGRLAYFWTGLRHVRRAASPVKITIDGRSWFDGMAELRAAVATSGGLRAAFRHSTTPVPTTDGWR